MTEVGQLISPKPLAINAARGAQKDAGGEAGQNGEAGFQALLEVVELIAARGGEVPAEGELPQGLKRGQPRLGRIDQLPPEVLTPPQTGELPAALQQLPRYNRFPLAQTGQVTSRPVATPPTTSTSLSSSLEALRSEAVASQPTTASNASSVPKPIEQFLQAAAAAAENPQLQQERQLFQPAKLETQIADAPRIDAVIQQQASPETSNPVVRQVASNIQVIARGEMERVRFELFPEELGRVQVQLQKNNGVARITIVTETPQAFEALQRGASGLQQTLSQAGFDTDDVRFEHRDGQDQGRQEADQREERRERRAAWDEAREEREIVIRQAGLDEREIFL